MLIDRGVNVNTVDGKNKTAHIYATQNGNSFNDISKVFLFAQKMLAPYLIILQSRAKLKFSPQSKSLTKGELIDSLSIIN